MIAWWWLLVVFPAGVFVGGVLVTAVIGAGGISAIGRGLNW